MIFCVYLYWSINTWTTLKEGQDKSLPCSLKLVADDDIGSSISLRGKDNSLAVEYFGDFSLVVTD